MSKGLATMNITSEATCSLGDDSLGHYYGQEGVCLYIDKCIGQNAWTKADALYIKVQYSQPTSGQYWLDPDIGYIVASDTKDILPAKLDTERSMGWFELLDDTHWTKEFRIGFHASVQVQMLKEGEQEPFWTQQMKTLKAMQPKGFKKLQFPEVLCSGNVGRLHYWVRSRVPGKSLRHCWPLINDEEIKDNLIKSIVDAHNELAMWRSDRICAVGGGELLELMLRDETEDSSTQFSSQSLRRNAESMGYDCSEIVFAHNVPSPDNIMVDPALSQFIGMIRWDSAGFVPKDHVIAMQCAHPLILKYPGWDVFRLVVRDWSLTLKKEMARQGYTWSAPSSFHRWSCANHTKKVKQDEEEDNSAEAS
nr:tRNA (guanine-N(1)-)-methyltransferase [Verruciconidia persicina]